MFRRDQENDSGHKQKAWSYRSPKKRKIHWFKSEVFLKIGKFGAPTYTVTFFNPNLSPFRSIGCPFAGIWHVDLFISRERVQEKGFFSFLPLLSKLTVDCLLLLFFCLFVCFFIFLSLFSFDFFIHISVSQTNKIGSLNHIKKVVHEGTRTPNLPIRSRTSYPLGHAVV